MSESVLSSQQLAECREAFAMLDKDGAGQLPAESLGRLIRMIGQNPSDAEVRELAAGLHGSGSPSAITCDDFCDAVSRRLHSSSASSSSSGRRPATELEEAFRALDRRLTGRLAATRLRALLTSMGEPLSPAEVDELLLMAKPASATSSGGEKEAAVGQDDSELFIDYRSLARRLLAK
uniref:EF-hand domain-containing protein n=1 Tax=Macrostomum lignano TaxID=282301 RepID=A0A1I8HS74_9PLAT